MGPGKWDGVHPVLTDECMLKHQCLAPLAVLLAESSENQRISGALFRALGKLLLHEAYAMALEMRPGHLKTRVFCRNVEPPPFVAPWCSSPAPGWNIQNPFVMRSLGLSSPCVAGRKCHLLCVPPSPQAGMLIPHSSCSWGQVLKSCHNYSQALIGAHAQKHYLHPGRIWL